MYDDTAERWTGTAIRAVPRTIPVPKDEGLGVDAEALAAWQDGRRAALVMAVVLTQQAAVAAWLGAWVVGLLLLATVPGFALATCEAVERVRRQRPGR